MAQAVKDLEAAARDAGLLHLILTGNQGTTREGLGFPNGIVKKFKPRPPLMEGQQVRARGAFTFALPRPSPPGALSRHSLFLSSRACLRSLN